MSMDDGRILCAFIKRDLEQLNAMRSELKEIFREHYAAMSKLDPELKDHQRESE